jgi:hypothetical protein
LCDFVLSYLLKAIKKLRDKDGQYLHENMLLLVLSKPHLTRCSLAIVFQLTYILFKQICVQAIYVDMVDYDDLNIPEGFPWTSRESGVMTQISISCASYLASLTLSLNINIYFDQQSMRHAI